MCSGVITNSNRRRPCTLARASGDGPAAAIFKGGASFGATVLVLFAVFHFAMAGS